MVGLWRGRDGVRARRRTPTACCGWVSDGATRSGRLCSFRLGAVVRVVTVHGDASGERTLDENEDSEDIVFFASPRSMGYGRKTE